MSNRGFRNWPVDKILIVLLEALTVFQFNIISKSTQKCASQIFVSFFFFFVLKFDFTHNIYYGRTSNEEMAMIALDLDLSWRF